MYIGIYSEFCDLCPQMSLGDRNEKVPHQCRFGLLQHRCSCRLMGTGSSQEASGARSIAHSDAASGQSSESSALPSHRLTNRFTPSTMNRAMNISSSNNKDNNNIVTDDNSNGSLAVEDLDVMSIHDIRNHDDACRTRHSASVGNRRTSSSTSTLANSSNEANIEHDVESGTMPGSKSNATSGGEHANEPISALQTCVYTPDEVQMGNTPSSDEEPENPKENAMIVESGELPLGPNTRRNSMGSLPRSASEMSTHNEETGLRRRNKTRFGSHFHRHNDEDVCKECRMPRLQTHHMGLSLSEWRRFRVERLRRKNKHSYTQRRYAPDQIESGKRKKRSALHGTGSSKWYEAKNWYYVLLDWSWAFVFFLSLLSYVITCFFWSLLTWPIANSIECQSGMDTFLQGTLGIAAVYATSNVLTLGYGPCLPSSYGCYTLACAQQFTGLMLNVIVLSVVVSKFQIPKPDIVFSKKALVTTRDGKPTLLIRVGNRRVNLVYETRVAVALLRFHDTEEGEHFVSYENLQASFPPTITAVATIIHEIDQKSPLRRFLLDPDEMANIVLSVSFVGHDSVYNDMLVCTTQYKGIDLELGGILFGDMMERRAGGKGIRANFDKFDAVQAAVGITHEELMEALADASGDSDIPSDSEASDSEQARDKLWSGVASHSRRRRRKRKEELRNDTSRALVQTSLPAEPLANVVYICYGCVRVKNYLVRLCPYSRVVTMFIMEAGIPYQIIDIDWDNKPAWFTDAVPSARTPAVFFENKWTSNSRDIMRYLHHKFSEQAERLNRPHNLPVSTWAFFDALERHAHLLAFATREQVQEMLEMNPEETRGKVIVNLHGKGTGDILNKSRDAPGQRTTYCKLKRDRKVKVRPRCDGDQVHLCVSVKHRGDRLARSCPSSQKIEVLLRALGVSYEIVLVDVEDCPDWVRPDQLPMMLGPGPQERVTIGANAVLRLLYELYPKESEKLPQHHSFDECLALSEEIKLSVYSYMMRPDGTGAEPQRDAVDMERLSRVLKVLKPLDKLLEEYQAGCKVDGFSWHPFLSGDTQAGLDDFILAPQLLFFVHYILRPMDGFSLKKYGLGRLERYIHAMMRTPSMQASYEHEGAETFLVLIACENFAKEYPDWQPLRCQVTQERLEAEAAMTHRIIASYGHDSVRVASDGSISVQGGVSGPPFEMNTIYLAVGCVHRGEFLVKVCPYSRVVEMVAAEACIPFKTIKIDLLDKPEWFTATSNGMCPSIYWNGLWTSESQMILNVLRQLHPQLYGPLDTPLHIGSMDSLADLSEMNLFNASNEICEAYLKAKTNDPERSSKYGALKSLLGGIENQLRNTPGPFLHGFTCSVNDIVLVCSIWRTVKVCCSWFHDFNITSEGFPAVSSWLAHFERLDSFTSTMPDYPEPFLILFTAKFYGDAEDPEHSPLQVTDLVKSNEREALVKIRVKEFGSMSEAPENNKYHLAQLESILRLLDDMLAEEESQGAGPYLCGSDLGMTDILVFSELRFIEDCVEAEHKFSILDRNFPHLRSYVDNITEKPRFREFRSPVFIEMIRIHFSNRLSNKFPHLKLQREEIEHLQLVAINKITARFGPKSQHNIRRNRAPSRSTISTGMESQSQSSGTSSSTGDIEDLLFCI